MDKKFNRESSKDKMRPLTNPTSLQKQMAENRRPIRPVLKSEPVPDVADLMDEWFFGSNIVTNKANNNNNNEMITSNGGGGMDDYEEEIAVTSSPSRSNNSRLTQEWLQEAKRMVASSPARCDSPSRLVGSPRFGSAGSKDLDRRDPLSRSARRHRAVESFSGEILSKSAKHSRNRSETFEAQPATDTSPASVVHQWFSNILKPHHHHNSNNNTSTEPKHQNHQESSEDDQPDSPHPKPPKPVIRKSRFRDIPSQTQTQDNPIPRRTFRNPSTFPDTEVLSPPKNLIESAHRRSVSSSTCSLADNPILSPPKNLIESVHRRSISSSTCSIDKTSTRPDTNANLKDAGDGAKDLNVFLKEQKFKLRRISNGEFDAKARIILSGSSNSTSSMVAAICYAWFLENRIKNKKEETGVSVTVVAPVMNMKRRTMWKQRQAAWLFHHVGIDSSALLFSDEVNVDCLMITKQLSIQVIGQDALKTNGEVGSQCTILTDNYCEDAYDLLQIPILKKLLLAGIMLDTQNLNSSANFYTNRDAEAVQLLLVGSSPNYRYALFDQLMQEQRDGSFVEVLRQNYGKLSPSEKGDGENGEAVEEHNMVNAGRRSTSINDYKGTIIHILDQKNEIDAKNLKNSKISPKSVPAALAPTPAPLQTPARTPENRGKNKFFLAKWFGFGSK